jgi:DNA-binding CsgD family transcriptional regulator
MDHRPEGAGGDADTLDPHIMLYGELHLRVLPGPHPQGLPALLADLLAAGSAQGREALVRDRLHVIGADWLVHARMERRAGARPSLRAFAAGAPGAWVERGLVAGCHAFNPGCPATLPSGLPRVWDIAGLEAMAQSPGSGSAVRRLAAELRAGGCGSGLVFRVPAQEPAWEWCVVSLMSRTPHCGWIGEQALGLAVTLGLCLHEFLSRYVQHPAEPAAPALLPAQQHILQCLGHGWSNKEIARSLRLSLHAVDYHLRQLRRRFAVHNRTQLVRAAMARQPVEGFPGTGMPAG